MQTHTYRYVGMTLASICFLSLLVAGGSVAATAAPGNAPEHPIPSSPLVSKALHPNIAFIGGVFAALIGFSFLFLLYLKHCKRQSATAGLGLPDLPSGRRRHSGLDREVVERLPLFRFGALTGQKEGLECAVCLSQFEAAEALRLLPKCRHGFHVECVDTWLDAHSSCPLCRARVDPEDVFLLPAAPEAAAADDKPRTSKGRCGGGGDTGGPSMRARHSSAGETSTKSLLRAVIDWVDPREMRARRSVDYVALRKGGAAGVECLAKRRKDVMLLPAAATATATGGGGDELERRFGHQIIVDDGGGGLRPSDVLFLRSEMIITDCGRFSASRIEGRSVTGGEKRVTGERSMSEMTGLRGVAQWRWEEELMVEESTIRVWLEGLGTGRGGELA